MGVPALTLPSLQCHKHCFPYPLSVIKLGIDLAQETETCVSVMCNLFVINAHGPAPRCGAPSAR